MHQLAGALYQAVDAVVIDKFPWGKANHTEEPSHFLSQAVFKYQCISEIDLPEFTSAPNFLRLSHK